MTSRKSEALDTVEESESTHVVPTTLEELAKAANAEAAAASQQQAVAESANLSALEHAIQAGRYLLEAQPLVKRQRKGFKKWLENGTNWSHSVALAYVYMGLTEYSTEIEKAGSINEARRIVDALKQQAIDSGQAKAHGNRGRVRSLPAAGESGASNGHQQEDADRSTYREELAQAAAATSPPAVINVTPIPATPVGEEDFGPTEEQLGDPELDSLVREFEQEALGSPTLEESEPKETVSVEISPEVIDGATTVRFQFEGSPQAVILNDFLASLDRFEVELGPVTLNRAFNVDLKNLTVALTTIQCRLDDLLNRVNKVVEDRRIKDDLKAARLEGKI